MDDKKLMNVINALEDAKPEPAWHHSPPPPYAHKPRSNKIGLVILMVLLGSATLGIGLGAGYAVMQYFAPDAQVTTMPDADPAVTSLRLTPSAIPINPQEPSFVDIIPQVKDSVVSIRVTNISNRMFGTREESPGSGSGFIFYEDGEYVFIATNNHVIEHASAVSISLDDNDSVSAQVIGTDRYSDLAVLAVSIVSLEEKGVPFTVATFGDSDVMRMGETVVAIGNSMGEGQIVTMGIISATNMQITIDDPGMRSTLTLDVMQTDAAVNRGNSGGPLVNQNGEVVGVVTAKLFGANVEGMGYALPINEAGAILMELKESGSARQPWIGIRHNEVTQYIRDMFNLPVTGILIVEVMPDTPAEEAGLQAFDLIAYFDGVRVETGYDFRNILLEHRPDDVITFGIYRNHELIEVEITLGSAMF